MLSSLPALENVVTWSTTQIENIRNCYNYEFCFLTIKTPDLNIVYSIIKPIALKQNTYGDLQYTQG